MVSHLKFLATHEAIAKPTLISSSAFPLPKTCVQIIEQDAWISIDTHHGYLASHA
jgi:hypothetical protein